MDDVTFLIENRKLIFEIIKWVVISGGVAISFWIIDVGRLKLERLKASNANKQNLLNTYLQATQTPNPDLWLRKLRLIKALSEKEMADMMLWAEKEEKYIKEVSALVVLYKEVVKVASVLSNRNQYQSPNWKEARNRFYELYHGELVFYKESRSVEEAMIRFKLKLEALLPEEDRSWDEMDQELLKLTIVLSKESEKLRGDFDSPFINCMHIDTFFRANVGAIITNDEGKVLVFERKKIKDAWQFPQGGIDRNESSRVAVERELFEETGIRPQEELEYLDSYPDWLVYELCEDKKKQWTGRGQAQKWFLFKIKSGVRIDLKKAKDKEFSNWKWTEMDQIVETVVEFRRPVYKKLRDWLAERKNNNKQ